MVNDDLFRTWLDQMIDLRRPLAVLARRMPWAQIEASLAPLFAREGRPGRVVEVEDLFGTSVQTVGAGVSPAGRSRLPIRLMASLLYLKHAFNLSDEEVVERWAVNVVWQYFSGQEYYEPRLPCDATQIGRFRRAIGEAGVEELLKATIVGKQSAAPSVILHPKAPSSAFLKRKGDGVTDKLEATHRGLAGRRPFAGRLLPQPRA